MYIRFQGYLCSNAEYSGMIGSMDGMTYRYIIITMQVKIQTASNYRVFPGMIQLPGH